MCRMKMKWAAGLPKKLLLSLIGAILSICYARAQAGDGVAGIEKATELMKDYFDVGTTLLYVIGAVVGLVGAIKVYNKWSSGDQDTSKAAASWFGACIFLVIVATALKSFFGV